jgi:hypothetical protein
VSGTVVKGGGLLIGKKGEGSEGCKGHEAQGTLSRGSHLFSDTDRRQSARSNPFRCASCYPFSLASRLGPRITAHQIVVLWHSHSDTGPRTSSLLPPPIRKKNRQIGPHHRALPTASWLIKEV